MDKEVMVIDNGSADFIYPDNILQDDLQTFNETQSTIQRCKIVEENAQTIDDASFSEFLDFDIKEAFEPDLINSYAAKDNTEHIRELIYEGAQLRYEESMLLLMAFCVRHKLSGAATSDLIEIISLHCPKNANIVKTFRQFKSFFQSLESPMIRHYYCPNASCQVYNGINEPLEGDQCTICKKSLSNESFFIELPVKEQLRSLLANSDFQEKLKYRFTRTKKDNSAIEDVYDGEMYQQLCSDDGFLSSPYNLSLVGNSDGVAVVKSSGASIWPVYVAINELSPKERFSRRNRILAGLWFGKGKPYFPTFMRPFSLSIQDLYFEGIHVQLPDTSSQKYRAIVLDMSLDAPARCLWQCMKQFNAYNGCGKCKEPGKQLVIGVGQHGYKRQCHIYPYNPDTISGHATSRTHEETKMHAKEALENAGQGKAKPSVEGVSGLSWGFGLPQYDVIKGTPVDYMHCICEGVLEQILEKWFGIGENTSYPCFMGKIISNIDEDIQKIKPITEITRKPRKLTDRKDWKASEKKSFLLHYSIPVLINRLPQEYLEHYMLLAGATYRLLKDSISIADLRNASLFLKLFCAQAPGLYGERFQTFNCHQLLHLAEDVKSLGPLWAYSCFPFEDFNGDLKELFHGTLNISGQIINSVCALQKMPEIAEKTVISPVVKEVYNKMMSKSYQTHKSKSEEITHQNYVIGGMRRDHIDKLHKDLQDALQVHQHPIGDFFWEFKRCCVNNVIFHSSSYLKVTVRNNYTALTEKSDYVSIETYVKVTERCTRAQCTIERKCSCDLQHYYYAIAKPLRCAPIMSPSFHGEPVVDHLFKVHESDRKVAVPVNELKTKVLRIDIKSGVYISLIPNWFEKD